MIGGSSIVFISHVPILRAPLSAALDRHRKFVTGFLFLVFVAWPLFGESFTVIESKGTVKNSNGGAWAPVALKQAYAYGTRIPTGRRSHVEFELSSANTVLGLARAEVAITVDTNDLKIKRSKLTRGTVQLKPGRWRWKVATACLPMSP